jgi:hypothetical protein
MSSFRAFVRTNHILAFRVAVFNLLLWCAADTYLEEVHP